MSDEIRGNIPLGHVKLGAKCPYFESKLDLLNSYDTYEWVRARNGLLGWTYSFDMSMLRHFRRLIVGQPINPHVKSVRFAGNVHQKVYIDKKEMLISSANLVSPTIQNVSMIVRNPILINHMRITFNKHWKAL